MKQCERCKKEEAVYVVLLPPDRILNACHKCADIVVLAECGLTDPIPAWREKHERLSKADST